MSTSDAFRETVRCILKVYRNRSELERAFSDFIDQSFSQFIRKEDAEKV
jgi:hypothetical protein